MYEILWDTLVADEPVWMIKTTFRILFRSLFLRPTERNRMNAAPARDNDELLWPCRALTLTRHRRKGPAIWWCFIEVVQFVCSLFGSCAQTAHNIFAFLVDSWFWVIFQKAHDYDFLFGSTNLKVQPHATKQLNSHGTDNCRQTYSVTSDGYYFGQDCVIMKLCLI